VNTVLHFRNPGTKVFLLFFAGIFALSVGAMPLLEAAGISARAPYIFHEPLFAKIVLIISGFLLLYTSFTKVVSGLQRLFSVISAVAMAVLGSAPLIIEYGLVKLPVNLKIEIPLVAVQFALIFYGIYMLISAYRIHHAVKMLKY